MVSEKKSSKVTLVDVVEAGGSSEDKEIGTSLTHFESSMASYCKRSDLGMKYAVIRIQSVHVHGPTSVGRG